MESVSSCSPGASTSSTSATGPSFSQPTAETAANRGSAKDRHQEVVGTHPSFGAAPMPHFRDERRDDTYLLPPGDDRAKWAHAVARGIAPHPATARIREQHHGMATYFPQTIKTSAPWSHAHATSATWYALGDGSAGAGTSSIPCSLPGGIVLASGDYQNQSRAFPWGQQHSNPFFSRSRVIGDYEQQRILNQRERQNVVPWEEHPSTSMEASRFRSTVIIPPSVVIPKELASKETSADSPTEGSLGKRSTDTSNKSESSPILKRSKGEMIEGRFDKLDLLCSATLELGPLQENPSGCSCPKSKCIALYCDCFKAGRRCNPDSCSCLNCKNTVEESGPDGARSKVSASVAVTIKMAILTSSVQSLTF